MNDLSFKIGITVHPIFVSQKLEQVVKSKEVQPPIINQQCMDNSFSCQLRNADYVGYTPRHLDHGIFKHKNSVSGKHRLEAHGISCHLNESELWILRNALCARCYLPKNAIHASTQRAIPSVRDSLFNTFIRVCF